jgi:hypothetical protein
VCHPPGTSRTYTHAHSLTDRAWSWHAARHADPRGLPEFGRSVRWPAPPAVTRLLARRGSVGGSQARSGRPYRREKIDTGERLRPPPTRFGLGDLWNVALTTFSLRGGPTASHPLSTSGSDHAAARTSSEFPHEYPTFHATSSATQSTPDRNAAPTSDAPHGPSRGVSRIPVVRQRLQGWKSGSISTSIRYMPWPTQLRHEDRGRSGCLTIAARRRTSRSDSPVRL